MCREEPYQLRRPAGARELDISAAVRSAGIVEPAQGAAALRLRLLLGASPSARPDEVFRWALDRPCKPQDVLRTGLWKLSGQEAISPMDLGALKLAKAPPAAAAPLGPITGEE